METTLSQNKITLYQSNHKCSGINCQRCHETIEKGQRVERRIVGGKAKYYQAKRESYRPSGV